MSEEKKINPNTGKPYPDISENVWSRFDDDGYGIRLEKPKDEDKDDNDQEEETRED